MWLNHSTRQWLILFHGPLTPKHMPLALLQELSISIFWVTKKDMVRALHALKTATKTLLSEKSGEQNSEEFDSSVYIAV